VYSTTRCIVSDTLSIVPSGFTRAYVRMNVMSPSGPKFGGTRPR
jgi:hypothetical protein